MEFKKSCTFVKNLCQKTFSSGLPCASNFLLWCALYTDQILLLPLFLAYLNDSVGIKLAYIGALAGVFSFQNLFCSFAFASLFFAMHGEVLLETLYNVYKDMHLIFICGFLASMCACILIGFLFKSVLSLCSTSEQSEQEGSSLLSKAVWCLSLTYQMACYLSFFLIKTAAAVLIHLSLFLQKPIYGVLGFYILLSTAGVNLSEKHRHAAEKVLDMHAWKYTLLFIEIFFFLFIAVIPNTDVLMCKDIPKENWKYFLCLLNERIGVV
ncbi:hypothetical protein NECID01_0365 [Nematocida sp. AWRm77]|nr:hypothetical protein NECID01_0365 [Nematocida sp. AWRm77]